MNNVLAGFFNNFKNGFIASFILSAIPLILRFKFKALVKMIFSKAKIIDSCKLATFAGLLNAVYKAVLCLVRRCYPASQTKRANQVAAPIAGFLAGLTLILENKFRKQYLMIIALSRCIDTALNLTFNPGHKPPTTQDERQKPIDNTKRDFVLWIFANMYTQYAVSCQKQVLNIDVLKFYTNWAKMTKPDMQLVSVWHKQNADGSLAW